MRLPIALGCLLAVAMATPAQAEVVAKADNGFVVRVAARVTPSPAEAWKTLVVPATWWSGQHTFSGDAANLTLDPVPGGCFCEKLPLPKDAAKGARPGGVQHLRVIYADPGKALRLSGALGPLQSEALQGTLTITIKPMDGGSRILFEYVVGGFMRYPVDQIAPAVDKMLSAQLASLATKLGPVAGAEPAPLPSSPPAAPETNPEAAPPSPGATTPQNWSLPPGPKAAPAPDAAPAATELPAVPTETAAPAPAPAPAPAVAPAKARPAAGRMPVKPKPLAKAPAAQAPIDKDHDDANAAFDAALGAAAPPQ